MSGISKGYFLRHVRLTKSEFYTDVVGRFLNGVFCAVGTIPNQEQPLTIADYRRMTAHSEVIRFDTKRA